MHFYIYPNNNEVIIYLYNQIRQTVYHVSSAYKNNRGLYTRTTLAEREKKCIVHHSISATFQGFKQNIVIPFLTLVFLPLFTPFCSD